MSSLKITLLKVARYGAVIGVIVYAILTLGITAELFGIGTIQMVLFNGFTWGVLYYAYCGANDAIEDELSFETKWREKQKEKKWEKQDDSEEKAQPKETIKKTPSDDDYDDGL